MLVELKLAVALEVDMAGGERILMFINWPRTMKWAVPHGNQKANWILPSPVTFYCISSLLVERSDVKGRILVLYDTYKYQFYAQTQI